MVHKLIHRVTMFKLPGEEAQKQLLAAYDVLAKDQQKVRSLNGGIRSLLAHVRMPHRFPATVYTSCRHTGLGFKVGSCSL